MKDLVVIVSGAAGPSGRATCRALIDAGATVVGVGRNSFRLAALREAVPGVNTREIYLEKAKAVRRLADHVRQTFGHIDGLVHLVGGWRGGPTFADNTEQDWSFLSTSLIDTLRHTTLTMHDDLVASPAGRVVTVSSTSLEKPTAGNANYLAAKAASEAWMLALADSLNRHQSGRKEDPRPQTSAAVILAVKALVDDEMRAASPDRAFPGFTDVADLATAIVGLWSADAAKVNGTRITLPVRG